MNSNLMKQASKNIPFEVRISDIYSKIYRAELLQIDENSVHILSFLKGTS